MLLPVPALAALPVAGDEERPRQCGRCRLFFDGDPALPPDAKPEWWICPPCHEILLGSGSRGRGAPQLTLVPEPPAAP